MWWFHLFLLHDQESGVLRVAAAGLRTPALPLDAPIGGFIPAYPRWAALRRASAAKLAAVVGDDENVML
jgi:hypothetical protein